MCHEQARWREREQALLGELEEARDSLQRVKQSGFNYEEVTQAQTRQFGYETANLREEFQAKLARAKEDALQLRQERDRLQDELDRLQRKSAQQAEELTAFALAEESTLAPPP